MQETMDTEDFLFELELLTHNARIRRMLELGRASAAGDESARASLAPLSAHADPYVRILALYAALGAKDGPAVLATIRDKSRIVRHTAARLAALVCSDAEIQQVLGHIIERRTLSRLVIALVRHKRSAPVDAFLASHLADVVEHHVVDLLPFASDAVLDASMRAMEEAGSPTTWARFAVRYPARVASAFARVVETSPSLDLRQRYRYFPLLPAIARGAPDAALKLMASLFAHGEEPSALAEPIRELLTKRPRETFDLLRARHESGRPTTPPGAFGIVRFDKVVHHLGAERLAYLLVHANETLGDGKKAKRWFLRLSASDQKAVVATFLERGRGSFGAYLFRHASTQSSDAALRERAFERWSHAARYKDGTILPEVLDWLPSDLRKREATRHLTQCQSLSSKPERRTAYARLLPFLDAQTTLAPWLGHPEGEERARAQGILMGSVLHDRAAMSRALEWVRARKFEQDPVRLAMLQALAALPITHYKQEHLESVGVVLQDALDAADLSNATASAMERLVVLLFRLDGPWGARWLKKLLETRGTVSTWGIGANLTESEVRVLSPALAELAHDWATRERASALLNLAQSLNSRLSAVPPLIDALLRLVRELPFVGVAAGSLTLLKQHARPTFAELVPSLLADDKSFILLPVVSEYISRRRQDLLEAFLEPKPMTGRFASGRTHWVIDFASGQERWTSRQQKLYAQGLIALLRDPKRDVPTLLFAIRKLVRLAFVDPGSVTPFASDARPPLREMAVRMLPWLDGGEGVPALVACLGDDRARYAIYALRKSFTEMPRSHVLSALRAVPSGKVTVVKEVVRLLGEMGGEEAYRDLVALDNQALHRDVRIALLRALWHHLDNADTWRIFEQAAADPDWMLSVKLADIPVQRLSSEAEERLSGLLAKILRRPESEARLELLKRAAYLPLRDERRHLFSTLLQHAGANSVVEAEAALSAALKRMVPGEVSALVQRLSELAPRRELLGPFVSIVTAQCGPYGAKHHIKVAEGLLMGLKDDTAAVSFCIHLTSLLHGHAELAKLLVGLAARDQLHYDAMVSAMKAVHASAQPILLEQTLKNERAPQLRRLALAALESAAAPENGWTRERRERLAAYRQDPSPAVSGPASFVFPPD